MNWATLNHFNFGLRSTFVGWSSRDLISDRSDRSDMSDMSSSAEADGTGMLPSMALEQKNRAAR